MTYNNNHVIHIVHCIDSIIMYTPSSLFMIYICQDFCVAFGVVMHSTDCDDVIVSGVDRLDSTVLLLDVLLSTIGEISCVRVNSKRSSLTTLGSLQSLRFNTSDQCLLIVHTSSS